MELKLNVQKKNIIYNSMSEAERMTGIPNSNISKVCKGERKTAGGYHWEVVENEQDGITFTYSLFKYSST